MIKPFHALALFGCSALLAACGGAAVPGASQGVAPDAARAAAAITIAPSSLAFNASAVKKTFTVAEKGYAGKFTATAAASSCAKVATVKQNAANKKAFIVTSGTKAGTCAIKVTDAKGNSASVKAVVTLTTGVIN